MKYLFIAAFLIANASAAVSVSFAPGPMLFISITGTAQFNTAVAGSATAIIIKQAGNGVTANGPFSSTWGLGTAPSANLDGTWQTGVVSGLIGLNDLVLYVLPPVGYVAGDTLTFSGGGGTFFNYTGSVPANGSYDVVIIDGSGNDITAVPEPSSMLIAGLGVAGLLRRRR